MHCQRRGGSLIAEAFPRLSAWQRRLDAEGVEGVGRAVVGDDEMREGEGLGRGKDRIGGSSV